MKSKVLVALLTLLAAGDVFAGGRFISLALLDKIHPGVTTEQQVRDLLGQSVRAIDYPARGQYDWQYEATEYGDFLEIWITFGNDGIVRGVMRMKPTAVAWLTCGPGDRGKDVKQTSGHG